MGGPVVDHTGGFNQMKKATKKELCKHTKKFDPELGHNESKHWCDCKIRKYRLWLGLKLYGKKELDDQSITF